MPSNTSAPSKHAQKFGVEISKALAERGVTRKAVYEALSLDRSTMSNYCGGKNLPRMETAARLAEILDWPKLADIVRMARERKCQVCGKAFIDNSNKGLTTKSCSHACRHLLWMRKTRYQGVRRGVVTNHRWEIAIEQIAKFCWDCQPQGLCEDSECHLRGLSPLPLRKSDREVGVIQFRKRA